MAKRKAKTSKKKVPAKAQQAKRPKPGPKEDILIQMDRIAAWVSKYTKKLRECILIAGGREIEKAQHSVLHLEQVIDPIDDLCDRLNRQRPELCDRIIRQLATIKDVHEKAKYALLSAGQDPSMCEIADHRIIDLNNAFAQLMRILHYTKKELQAKKTRRRLPLPKRARLIYNKLNGLAPEETMTTDGIALFLQNDRNILVDDSTIRRDLKLLKPYGLKKLGKKQGYYIEKDSR